MKNELILKIKNTLEKLQKEESDIVHLMVKIRKFLDEDKNNEYKILKSYCDWTLHDKITRNGTCQNILKEIEIKYKKGKGIDPIFVIDILHLDIFKRELKIFLQSLGIVNIFINDKDWFHFRKLFIDNFVDCPIEPENKVGLIEKFSFKKYSNYDINFELKLFNERVLIKGSSGERFSKL